ncbi:hypothetical protein Tco_0661920, partial [Tanacetum coccineum]
KCWREASLSLFSESGASSWGSPPGPRSHGWRQCCLLGAAYVCDIHTSYVSRQCTSSDEDSAAPCLLRRLATPDWLTLASWGD